MAGYVNVYQAKGFEGCINIASERLKWLLHYLTQCQQSSAILKSDLTFDPWKDMSHSNYCTLAGYSDATVAEIGRLLIEGAEPSHPFWSDGTKFFDPNFGPNKGLDPETEIKACQTWAQKAFRDVAALIQKRLERNALAGVETNE